MEQTCMAAALAMPPISTVKQIARLTNEGYVKFQWSFQHRGGIDQPLSAGARLETVLIPVSVVLSFNSDYAAAFQSWTQQPASRLVWWSDFELFDPEGNSLYRA